MRKQYHFWPGEQGLDAWDVDRLISIAAGLPIANVPIESISEVDSVYWFDENERPTVRKVVEHVRLIRDVEVKYPIILGSDGRVMDGLHRIARAILDGRDALPSVRLNSLPPPDYVNCRPAELPYDEG